MTEESSPAAHSRPPDPLFCHCRRASLTAAAAVLAAAVWVQAAAAQTTDDTQLWLSANTQGSIRGPYRVSLELHGRWRDDMRHFERTVARLQGGRTVTKHLTAWFGFEENWPFEGRIPEERRLWQQVIVIQPAGIWALSHRARLEERYVDGVDRMVPRLRYSLRATRPLHAKSAWGAVLATEFFFQLRDVVRGSQPYPAGLDRDRVQAGVSRRLTHAVSVEPSYLLQFINSPTPLPNRREHILQLQIAHRF
jgi:hypothetical protein